MEKPKTKTKSYSKKVVAKKPVFTEKKEVSRGNKSKSTTKVFTYSKLNETSYSPDKWMEGRSVTKSKTSPNKSKYKSKETTFDNNYTGKDSLKVKTNTKTGKTKAVSKINGKKTKQKWQ